MSTFDLTNKKFLIVDAIKQSSSTLKLHIQNLGSLRVDESSRINDIIYKCENFDYDCLLLGYDFGENKKNGQQLLEELRLKKLISRHCIVIMITAELSQKMVMAALEHKPNEYLAKPFTLKELSIRIERTFRKAQSMAAIYQAMDDNNPEKVIKLAQEKIKNSSPYSTECLGIISRQFFQLKQFDQAAQIYHAYENVTNCQWAVIGLGKIALENKNFIAAKQYFESIINKYPHYLSAYDWLATSYQRQNNLGAAESTLAKAINISPRSFFRMHHYAKTCFENGNFEQATQAYLQTNELAQNTLHKQPSIAYDLAKSFLEYAEHLPIQQIKQLNSRIFNVLHSTNRDFPSPEVSIQTGLFNAHLHFIVQNIAEYAACLKRAENTLERRIDDLPLSSMEEIAEQLFKLDRGFKADKLLFKIEKFKKDNQELLVNYQEQPIDDINLINKNSAQIAIEKAINLYQNQKYSLALTQLNQALALYPDHQGIKLNILQVLLLSYEEDKSKVADLKQAKALIEELENNLNFKQANSRFKQLKNKFDSLKK